MMLMKKFGLAFEPHYNARKYIFNMRPHNTV